MNLLSSTTVSIEDENDGGYFAIKGFLYQFDKSLLEVIQNQEKQVEIETIQDISFDVYVLQVKLKEAKDYFDSSVRKPIKQLIEIFIKEPNRKLILYCHFRNRSPEKKQLNEAELNSILGKDENLYASDTKQKFVQNFILQFSENYIQQFETVIDNISTNFGCADKDLAIIYHSILHSKLMQLAVLPSKNDRQVCYRDLKRYLADVDKKIFFKAYEIHLSRDKYNTLIKKQYFTFPGINIDNFERLFIVGTSVGDTQTDLMQIINRIVQRYYKLSKSPAPYILFENLHDSQLISLKQSLVDKGVPFSDGTTFNGDKFRLNVLLPTLSKSQEIKVKIIKNENLDELLTTVKFDEVYYLASNFSDNHQKLGASTNFLKIQITDTKQILNFL
jgi:hypothetical protein